MARVTSYRSGVPCLVDLLTQDLDKALRFYGDLFGWEGRDAGAESGHYTMRSKDGLLVAALSPASDPGPPHWTTYVSVDDADAVTARVESAGGKVLFGPMDVMAAGRMAIYADATGAIIAAWQPGEHPGAELVNEAGALVWNELTTSDLARSRSFYSDAFGWGWAGTDGYAEAQVDGRTVAGVMPRPAGMPAGAPDAWLVYFATDDLDADTARAAGIGATVTVAPTVIDGTGRFSVLLDPEGAPFGLFQG